MQRGLGGFEATRKGGQTAESRLLLRLGRVVHRPERQQWTLLAL